MGNQPHRASVSEIRAAVLTDTRAKIAAHGWTVIAVFPTPEDPGPSFAWLSGKGLPELAIYGLPGQVAHSLLNEVAPWMVESSVALQTGDRVEGVLVDDVPLVVVAMADARYRRAGHLNLNLVRECYGAVARAGGVAGLRRGAAVGGRRSDQRRRAAGACALPAPCITATDWR